MPRPKRAWLLGHQSLTLEKASGSPRPRPIKKNKLKERGFKRVGGLVTGTSRLRWVEPGSAAPGATISHDAIWSPSQTTGQTAPVQMLART